MTTPDTGSPVGTITVDVTLTRADMKAFNRCLRSANSSFGRLVRRHKVVLLVAYFVGAGGAIAASANDPLTLTLFASFIVYVISQNRFSTAILDLEADSFVGRFVADSEALTQHRQGMTSRIEWTAFENIWVTAEHIVLSLAPRSGLVIPLRAFSDEADRTRFVDMAKLARQHKQLTA